MKLLKGILVFVVIVVALILIAALFVRKAYTVEESITINQPESEVFDYIRYLKNQDNFSKWASMDPDMEQTYTGTDGTEGFVSAWDSDQKDVGKGEQTIVSITENERIDYDLHFIEPFDSRANAYMITEYVSDSSTTVRWGFSGKMNYPMNIMLLFMDMEGMIANDLSEGLSNLKRILEG